MLNDEEIYQYANNNGLRVLGWIHTHPTYNCFLSSIDLYTHFSYQVLLAESIAIVYSGKNLPAVEKIKVFRIKNKFLEEISQCNERGFHEHSEKNEECTHTFEYNPENCEEIIGIDGNF